MHLLADPREVAGLVADAMGTAMEQPDQGDRIGAIHYNRSRRFIAALAHGFRAIYPQDQGFHVFAGRDRTNRHSFGRDEFLYDLAVCECAIVPDGDRGAGLTYVKRAVWQVESELALSRRAAMADFSKLVVGAADFKLFIGPQSKSESGFLATLAGPAAHCGGVLYAALVPHPKSWSSAALTVSLWRWGDAGWTPIPDAGGASTA